MVFKNFFNHLSVFPMIHVQLLFYLIGQHIYSMICCLLNGFRVSSRIISEQAGFCRISERNVYAQ